MTQTQQAQPEALRLAMHLRQRAKLTATGNVDALSQNAANVLVAQYERIADLEAQAAAKCLHQIAEITDAEIDRIAESMPGGMDGFLKGWGWRQFAREVLQADPPAPAAVAAPIAAGMKAAADLVQEQADLYIAEHAETDPDTGAVIWHHRDFGFDWHNGLEELAQKLQACAALAAAPQAPAAPVGLPSGWVPCVVTHEGQNPEEVAYGPQIMMDRLGRWLGRYFTRIAQPAPAAPAVDAREDARDAARYRWLAGYCRNTSEHWGGRWSIVIDGPCPKSNDSEDDFDSAIDAAIDAARAAQGDAA